MNGSTLTLDILNSMYSLVADQDYSITVAAYNLVGTASVSPILIVKAAAPPNAPSACTKVAQSAGSITISWTTPYNGGSAITGYKIFWDNGSGNTDTSTF